MICEHCQFSGNLRNISMISLEEIRETEQKVFAFFCDQCPGWHSLEVPPELRDQVSPESPCDELRFSLRICLLLHNHLLARPLDLVGTSPDAAIAAEHDSGRTPSRSNR